MGNIQLLHVDCMEYMRNCPDKQFDLAIVDPPYGIGDTWSKSRKDTFYKHGALHSYQNESAPDSEYFSQLFRISKNQIIWGGNYFTEHLPATNSWIVWDKGRNAEITFMSEAELAWTSFKKVMRIARFTWDGARKCEVTQKIHPHQKPVKLYEWVLLNFAEPGFKIFDSHLGSGSIAIACDKQGMHLTATELDTKYHAAAQDRYLNHVAQVKIVF